MSYYLYAQPNGYPDISERELDLQFFPGYQFIGQYEDKPTFTDNKKYVNGEWVWRLSATEYSYNRKAEYPEIGNQLDMLWHAMDIGQIPKAQQFYDSIKSVKDKYPKGGQ